MIVKTKRVGLAAHMLIEGEELLRRETDGSYIFSTDKTEQEWRISYAQHRDSQYNATVLELLSMNKG